MKTKPPTEKEITKEIRRFLDFKRIWHWKEYTGGMFGQTGISDILGCWKGRFIAIEVKRPGHKTESKRLMKQKKFIEDVKRAGGIGFFAESVQNVIDNLKEYW